MAVVEEYVDHGVSGAKERRPRLDALMTAARKGAFAAIIVWKFDRFARSTRHLVQALEEFQTLGIHFISLTESIDTSTPMGRMVFTVLGAVAELERSLICERVTSGLARARKQGKTLGRPKNRYRNRLRKKSYVAAEAGLDDDADNYQRGRLGASFLKGTGDLTPDATHVHVDAFIASMPP